VTAHLRWPAVVAWVLGAAAAFAVYLRLASTRAVNSDGASSALQAWDMLHGNPLLRGWTLGDASYYLTELPEYMLVELVRGLNQNVVHVAAALTYTLALAGVAWLAKGSATGREGALRAGIAVGIMLAPQLNSGMDLLLSSPDHFGTSVPVLLAWLILDRAKPRWYIVVIASLLLALAEVGDLSVLTVAVLPLIIVCAVRVFRAVAVERRPLGSQRHEIALGAGAVAAGVAGPVALSIIHALGGFYAAVPSTQLSPLSTILGHNVGVTGQGVLLISGGDFLGMSVSAGMFFTMLHIVGAVLLACGVVLAAWRFLRDTDRVSQLLLAGSVLSVGAYLVSVRGETILFAHDIAPVLPLAAALAGRQLGGRLLAIRPRRVLLPALAVVLCGYLAGLVFEISQPSVPAQNQQLTSWLEAHHLRDGLSGYWGASVVTLTSGGRVSVRPIQVSSGQVTRKSTLVKAAWFDPGQATANFVVLFPGTPIFPGFTYRYPGLTDRAEITAAFGEPAQTYHVGGYTILLWHKNLLADVTG
jgi:hypothetical protein